MPTITWTDINTGDVKLYEIIPKMDKIVKDEGCYGFLAGWTAEGKPHFVWQTDNENRKELWAMCDDARSALGLLSFKHLDPGVQESIRTSTTMNSEYKQPGETDMNAPTIPTVPSVPNIASPAQAQAQTPAPLPVPPMPPTGTPTGTVPQGDAADQSAQSKAKRGPKRELHATNCQIDMTGQVHPFPYLKATVQEGSKAADDSITRTDVGEVVFDFTKMNGSAFTQLAANGLAMLLQQKTRTLDPAPRFAKLQGLYQQLQQGDMSLFDKKAPGRKAASKEFSLVVQAYAQLAGIPLLTAQGKWDAAPAEKKAAVEARADIQAIIAQLRTGGNTSFADELLA